MSNQPERIGGAATPDLGPTVSARWRSPLLLVGAQAVGQLSMLAAVPAITRAFEPEEVGLYQVALSVALVLQPLATLRVEFVLPVAKSRAMVSALVSRAHWSISISVAVVALAGISVGALVDPAVGKVLTMTAILLVVYSWIAVDNALLIRSRRLPRLAARNLMGGLLSGCLQLLVAMVVPMVVALAVAVFVARVTTILVTRVRKSERPSIGDGTDDLGYGAKRVITTVGLGLVSSSVLQALTLLCGALFGQVAAGYVGTAQRLSGTPASLVGQGIGQFVQSSLASVINSRSPQLTRAVLRIEMRLAVVALVVAAGIGILGPIAAEPVLGPGWGPVGPVLALLAAPVAMQLMVSPMNPIMVMIGQERILLVMHVSRLTISVTCAATAGMVTGELLWTVGAFALATVVAYIANLIVVIWRVRAFDASRAAQTGSLQSYTAEIEGGEV